jgi:16S rRNA (cytosine1402-N4)-methyltransferase
MPKKFGQIDPATRTFQALRIAVNNELGQLEDGLKGALVVTKNEGRIVVVDFHSLEDRIVKTFFANNSAKKVHVSRYKETEINSEYPLSFVSKVILPTDEECSINPRSRSAKLRYAIIRKDTNNE